MNDVHFSFYIEMRAIARTPPIISSSMESLGLKGILQILIIILEFSLLSMMIVIKPFTDFVETFQY